MMNKTTIDCTIGAISGAILYALNLVCAGLPYLHVSFRIFCLILTISIVAGMAIILALVFKGITGIGRALLRLTLLFISFSCLFVANGYLGTIEFMHKLLGVSSNSSADNVSGMLSLTFLAIMIVVCVVSMVAASIIFWWFRKGQTKKKE